MHLSLIGEGLVLSYDIFAYLYVRYEHSTVALLYGIVSTVTIFFQPGFVIVSSSGSSKYLFGIIVQLLGILLLCLPAQGHALICCWLSYTFVLGRFFLSRACGDEPASSSYVKASCSGREETHKNSNTMECFVPSAADTGSGIRKLPSGRRSAFSIERRRVAGPSLDRDSSLRSSFDRKTQESLQNLSQWYCNQKSTGKSSSGPDSLITARTLGRRSSSKTNIEILCVEDSAVERVAMRRFLKKQGFVVTLESSGEAALNLLQKRHEGQQEFPSLVIMDLMLEEMTGVAAAKLIRERYPLAALPIIFLSGEADQNVISHALDSGGNDYVVKPYTEGELLARIWVQIHMLDFWSAKLQLARDSQLLKEILPASVIHRLHSGEKRIADRLEQVTVLFSDIVGFTDLASSVATTAVVEMLDTLFSWFDKLTDMHGVYKVETIGDAYMVVAGLDEESRPNHAERALSMARDMISAAERVSRPDGRSLQIRLGVHTGLAYAGVVGCKRPRFCLFGDTVNVASRMESNSFPQCIHVSSEARDCYLRQAAPGEGRIEFEDLGNREIKGKGTMHTWIARVGEWEAALGALRPEEVPLPVAV
uniref:Guanylate cyclase soluble subunit beta n=1 Tax=Tetraselmis sp. GSL018 TaxID=582737 RepID=A0A061QZE9_9CHLO